MVQARHGLGWNFLEIHGPTWDNMGIRLLTR
jgi:hypothetical protein